MSTEQFNRKLEQGKKITTSIKKDLRYREDQQKRGQTTYSLDAEIKGSFNQLDEIVDRVEKIFNNFRANPKDFGFSNKEIENRERQYQQIANQRINLKRQFDSFFQKKSTKDLLGDTAAPNKPTYQKMSTSQLLQHKKNQQQQQDEAIDQLIGLVKNTKQGGKAINNQLKQQDVIINELDAGMDENIEKMGTVRRNMTKLLEQSSNCCLITVIVVEIVGIMLLLFLW